MCPFFNSTLPPTLASVPYFSDNCTDGPTDGVIGLAEPVPIEPDILFF